MESDADLDDLAADKPVDLELPVADRRATVATDSVESHFGHDKVVTEVNYAADREPPLIEDLGPLLGHAVQLIRIVAPVSLLT